LPLDTVIVRAWASSELFIVAPPKNAALLLAPG
jgi:hypothetical protein